MCSSSSASTYRWYSARAWLSACSRATPRPAADGLATPRRVCWLLLRPDRDLTDEEQAFRSHLYTVCPQVASAEALVKEFARVLRERDVDGLYAWLRVAQVSGIAELRALARSIWVDHRRPGSRGRPGETIGIDLQPLSALSSRVIQRGPSPDVKDLPIGERVDHGVAWKIVTPKSRYFCRSAAAVAVPIAIRIPVPLSCSATLFMQASTVLKG